MNGFDLNMALFALVVVLVCLLLYLMYSKWLSSKPKSRNGSSIEEQRLQLWADCQSYLDSYIQIAKRGGIDAVWLEERINSVFSGKENVFSKKEIMQVRIYWMDVHMLVLEELERNKANKAVFSELENVNSYVKTVLEAILELI